jgi:hypothetical protein
MPKILTQLKITEVSAVDRGAGEGVRILLMKRDTDEPHVEAYEKFLKIFTSKAAADGGDDDAGDRSDQNTGLADHPIVRLARLLVASGSQSDLASAVHYLLNTSHGAALLHRTRTHKGESPMPDNLTKIAEDIGIVRVAKAIVDEQRSFGIDEHEFVALVTEHAKRLHPNLSGVQAFAKVYESEPSVWQACAVLKAMPLVADLTPLVVGGEDAQATDNPAKAVEQLKQIGAQRYPSASPSAQFEKALVDPANHKSARVAVPIPRATTSYPFPL